MSDQMSRNVKKPRGGLLSYNPNKNTKEASKTFALYDWMTFILEAVPSPSQHHAQSQVWNTVPGTGQGGLQTLQNSTIPSQFS